MDAPNTLETPISEVHLRALYALLPEVISRNLYGPRFSKQFQVWRQFVHPPGVADIRTMHGQDGLVVQVNLGDRLGCDIYYGFFQEYCDYALFMALVSPDDVVVDIGANYGMYTLGAAKRLGPNGRVVAFEPDERSRVLLEQNVRLNHFEKLVVCVGACIGDHDGATDFFAAIDPSFSGIHDTGRSETSNHLTLPVRTLDSVLAELEVAQVDLVKIDVEGAEWEVLQGAQQTLADSDPVIMLEVSQKNLDEVRGEKLRVELERLGSQGYIGFWIDCECAVSAPRLEREDNLGTIARRQGPVSTINYFLLKREGPRAEALQRIFAGMLLDPTQARNEMVESYAPTALDNDESDLTQATAEIEDADRLRAMLWAEGVEKQVAIDVCRKMQDEMAGLKKQLAETSAKLAAEVEECATCNTQLHEAEQENSDLRSSNADYMTKLGQSHEKISALKNSNANYKAMLVTTDAELTALKASHANIKTLLAEKSQEIAAHIGKEELQRKALAETSARLAAELEECAACKTKLHEAELKNADLRSSNADYKAMLGRSHEEIKMLKASHANIKVLFVEKSQKLAAKIEENALYKAKLAKAGRELASANSGFIGLLIKARKRMLKWGSRHD